eukprot:CAMPEP_0118862420 /NCGR_PEP_ID=MMETSP1163-20130328/7632_1 /TAXON_ID=124430 /ORGANISM="Phaeomonas parva, Strain CCMP2877" /LENGTH=116 /DNA_ID=CAMNT_0006796325 /DNA_START=175 /DNA_END=525 /DNA_ORIENTATION=+
MRPQKTRVPPLPLVARLSVRADGQRRLRAVFAPVGAERQEVVLRRHLPEHGVVAGDSPPLLHQVDAAHAEVPEAHAAFAPAEQSDVEALVEGVDVGDDAHEVLPAEDARRLDEVTR